MAIQDILADAARRIAEALGLQAGGFTRMKPLIIPGTATLTALGTGNIDIQLPSDCDCVVTKIHSDSTGNYTARISKTDTDKHITDGQVLDDLLFGQADTGGRADGIDPFYCEVGAKLRFELVDLSNAENTVRLAVHCRLTGASTRR